MKEMKFVKTNPDAILKKPVYKDDAGMDLASVEDVFVQPGKSVSIPTGLRVEFPPGCWGRITARSSTIERFQVVVLEGIIDGGYRGELFVRVLNTSKGTRKIPKGTRVAQLILHETIVPYWIKEVKTLSPTERGSKGFGSSDEKKEPMIDPGHEHKGVFCFDESHPPKLKMEFVKHNTFVKDDSEKVRFDLVPPNAHYEVAEVLTKGAQKYGPGNWRKVDDRQRYIAAIERHLNEYKRGKHYDDDTGLHHLAHAATSCMFLCQLDLEEI